jgi:hypothetical protein
MTKKGAQSVGTDRTPEARFRAVPGGETDTLAGTSRLDGGAGATDVRCSRLIASNLAFVTV